MKYFKKDPKNRDLVGVPREWEDENGRKWKTEEGLKELRHNRSFKSGIINPQSFKLTSATPLHGCAGIGVCCRFCFSPSKEKNLHKQVRRAVKQDIRELMMQEINDREELSLRFACHF